jgi:hypothetical protein
MIECRTHSAYLGRKPVKRLYSAVKGLCVVIRREAKAYARKTEYRLLPIYYTSMADI